MKIDDVRRLTTDQLVRFIEKRALAWRPSTLRAQGVTA